MKKTTKRNNSRFERGSGVYTCGVCGKQTRETGSGESDVQLCVRCYDKAGDENAVADGHMTEEKFFETYGEHSPWYKPETGAPVAPVVELAPGTTVRILAARDGQDAAVVGELGTVCESPAGSEPLVLVGAHAPQWYRREDLAIVAEVERVAPVETDEQWEARQAEIARRESRLTFLADELPVVEPAPVDRCPYCHEPRESQNVTCTRSECQEAAYRAGRPATRRTARMSPGAERRALREQRAARRAGLLTRDEPAPVADELPSTSYKVTVTVTVPGVATHSPEDAARFVREMIEETLGEHRPTFKAASVAAESEVA